MTGTRAQELIQQLDLQPHPEGGHYREVYRSKTDAGGRAVVTAIYFLLQQGEISRLHQVDADELWHWIEGAPLTLLSLPPSLETMDTLLLGPPDPINQAIQVIPAHHWQAAESTGEYTLVACNVAPGFQFEGFTFLENEVRQESFRSAYPECARFI